MKNHSTTDFGRRVALCGILILAAAGRVAAEPPPAAVTAYNSYIRTVESRLGVQHGSASGFLAGADSGQQTHTRLRLGELIVEQLTPATGADLPGAMLHHWRGTAFAPGGTAADFERLMKDFDRYPQHFSPQVVRATILTQQGDHFEAAMRVRQRHILTVTMDATYDIEFGRLDGRHGFSQSRSTRITEIDAAGTSREHALRSSQEHGFLWRQNTYWSWEERDGGLYIEIESVSLTRSIPPGLDWAVGPFVESVPRESLEFTLRSVLKALHK